MRSGVPSSRITRAEPSIWIARTSNGSLSQQISSFWPSSAPASMAPRSWYGTSSLFSLRRPIRALLWLEITRNKSFAFAQPRDAHGLEILLKEVASSVRVLRLQFYGFAADVPQRAKDRSVVGGKRSFVQSLTACPIRCECGQVIIGPPARELGPFDRFELAVGKCQRFFGTRGASRET